MAADKKAKIGDLKKRLKQNKRRLRVLQRTADSLYTEAWGHATTLDEFQVKRSKFGIEASQLLEAISCDAECLKELERSQRLRFLFCAARGAAISIVLKCSRLLT